MADNEQAFFYEVCNLWNNEGPTSKNIQCFFIFTYTKGNNYFKVPNLSMKIKTKSEYDNTEVKAFVSYETLPVLINSLQDHVTNQHIVNESTQYSAHNFTYSLTVVDENRSKLKLTNNDGISNDIIMYRGMLRDIARTLRITYDNIITISLNFIKLSQNNEILDRLTNIESTVRKLIGFSHGNCDSGNNYAIKEVIDEMTNIEQPKEPFQGFDNVQVTPIPNANPEQAQQVPIPNAQPDNTRTMLLDGQPVDNVSKPVEEPPSPIGVLNCLVQASNMMPETSFTDDDTPPFDIDDFSVDSPSTVSNTMPSLQDALNNVVQSKVNEPTHITLKNKIHDIMVDAFNNNISIPDMVQKVIEEFTLLTSASINNDIIKTVDDMCTFFNTSFGSFSLYMRKLMFLVSHSVQIPEDTKVPMFIMRVKFPTMYSNVTKDLNTALLMLYEEYRNKVNGNPNKNPEDSFILSCLRFVFAPFWTSYLNVADVSYMNSQICNNLKLATSRFLLDWENLFMKNLDTFIYNAGLAFDINSVSNVERFFSQCCPTIDWCLNTQDNDDVTIEDIKTINRIVNTLKKTYSLEDVTIDINSGLHYKMTDNFVNCLMVFTKKNNITENTTDADLFNLLTFVVNNQKNGNNRELLKALISIDTNNGEMKVLSNEA